MAEFVLGVDGILVNLRHVQAIKIKKEFDDEWSIIASIKAAKDWTVLAGPFDTAAKAIEHLGWLKDYFRAPYLGKISPNPLSEEGETDGRSA